MELRRNKVLCRLGLILAWMMASPTFAMPGAEGVPEPAAMEALSPEHNVPCVDGFAGEYPCERVDLLSFMAASDLGGGSGNDIWGWTDPLTDSEYALYGLSNGTVFVDVTDPEHPVRVGNLPTQTSSSSWRDIKVYADHALIVSEASNHGMQVFDLTELRSVVSPPATFTATAHYPDFGSAHDIVVNEDSGYAYAVGTSTCSGGLHMIDVSSPLTPTFAGCFSADGYTHDAQCVNYSGPDPDYAASEICFACNEDTLTIVDVTDKDAPVQISRTSYSGVGYSHQGWLTMDHAYFLLGDELDESNSGHATKTLVWDLADLDAPSVVGFHLSTVDAIDHNQYIRGLYTYQANYRAGLRILRLGDLSTAELTEVAYFDIYPGNDAPNFNGAWSVYPFFESGTVVVSGIESGLFVLRPLLCEDPDSPEALVVEGTLDQEITLSWLAGTLPGSRYRVERALGGCQGDFEVLADDVVDTLYVDSAVSGQVTYGYRVSAIDDSGLCSSSVGVCVEESTTGPCTAPPLFEGVESAASSDSGRCGVDLAWSAADALCGGATAFDVYRGPVGGFSPSPDHLLASAVSGLGYHDDAVFFGEAYRYIVRARDLGNGSQESNGIGANAQPTGPSADGPWSAGAEMGDPAMTFASGATEHLGWHLSSDRAHSGQRSYFSTYGNGMCAAVSTPSLQLTPGQSPQLSLWTWFDIELEWDGGVIEISTDDGSTWVLLEPDGSYPGAFNSGGDACGYATGQGAFTGLQASWSLETVDLTAFAGQDIRLRWVFSTDGGLVKEGWYLDGLEVSHVQRPGTCSPISGLFADGFEAGDLSAWNGGE